MEIVARKIKDELAMFIVYADAQGYDLKIELSKDSSDKKCVPVYFFTQNLLRLALILIENADNSVRHDLRTAVSEESIKTAMELCRNQSNTEMGQPAIDIQYFISICKKKYQILTENDIQGRDILNDNDISFELPMNTNNRYNPENTLPTVEKNPLASKINSLSNENIQAQFQKVSSATRYDELSQNSITDDLQLSDREETIEEELATENAVFENDLILSENPYVAVNESTDSKMDTKASALKIEGDLNSKPESDAPSPEIMEHIECMRVLLEDILRKTVRQTDLYHKIQVYLGFIDCYTYVPPRGEIVVSTPRPWLTFKDIAKAFHAGRLDLNDFQIQIVILSVSKFAEEVRAVEKTVKVVPAIKSSKNLKDTVVVKSGPLLSAQWLRRYLSSLRLGQRGRATTPSPEQKTNQDNRSKSVPRLTQKKGSFNKSMRNRSQSTVADYELNETYSSNQRRIPMQWEEWLGQKLLVDKSKEQDRSREFRKSLAGLNNILSKEDILSYLEKYQIIPEQALQDEIQSRIKRWVADIDGRRDFKHSLNIEIRKWQKQEKSSWKSISIDERKKLIVKMKQTLLNNKVEELKRIEKSEQKISKELYSQYAEECREKSYQGTLKWGEWLKSYRQKTDEMTEKMIVNIRKRRQESYESQAANEAVIPIEEVVNAVNTAASLVGTPISNSIELKKQLVALRKEVARRYSGNDTYGIANHSVLVKKSDFDRCISTALFPLYQRLPPKIKKLADSALMAHDDFQSVSINNDDEKVFFFDKKEATERSIRLEAQSIEKNKDAYERWLLEKKEALSRDQMLLVNHDDSLSLLIFCNLQYHQANKKKEEEERSQQKRNRGKEAFAKWLKRRKRNKYFSVIDNSLRSVPNNSTLHHDNPWKQDIDNGKRNFS